MELITNFYAAFDIDVNVSVFETTIRLLGGLLSGHLLAIDPVLAIYSPGQYNNSLFNLAVDIGDRLMRAFDTKTGIPYGTVNLKHGVPSGETEIASTAGAGSLFLEFAVLSYLTGDMSYGEAAFVAMKALHSRRSPIGLLGKHINVKNGRWHETVSGIGSNSDSFYEYLYKGFLITRSKEFLEMFSENFVAIKRYLQIGDWFGKSRSVYSCRGPIILSQETWICYRGKCEEIELKTCMLFGQVSRRVSALPGARDDY